VSREMKLGIVKAMRKTRMARVTVRSLKNGKLSG
jgi:hypothetical protein